MKHLILASFLALTTLAAACGGAAPGAATPGQTFEEHRVHAEAQVQLWVPGGWTVDDGQPNLLVMHDPASEVGIMFAVVDAADLGSALLAVGASALLDLDDLELVGSPGEVSINGMPALFQDARAARDGTPLELSVGVIDTPADRYLIVVGAADAGRLAAHEATVTRIMEEIQPLPGA